MDAMKRFVFLLPLLFIILQQVVVQVVSSVAIEDQRNGDVFQLHSMDKGTTIDNQEKNFNININGEERIHEVIDDQNVHVDNNEDKNPKVLPRKGNHENNSLKVGEVMFFHIEELYEGKTMAAFFRNGSFSFKQFLPKQISDKIPFSLKQIPKILQILSIPEGSPGAQTVEKTLKRCEEKAIYREIKSCVTSVPSMLDFVRRTLGTDSIQYVSTKHVTGLSETIQNFTVTKLLGQIPADHLVVCHMLNYPYRIGACHSIEKTYGYRIHLLSKENGDVIHGIALCHFDTSMFRPDHIAFRVLGTKPGDGNSLCHFAPADNIIFFAAPSS